MTRPMSLELIHRLTSEDSAARDTAADEVTDVVRSLDIAEADLIARVLVAARLAEEVVACQEAQLHALVELRAWHDLSQMTLDRLRYVDSTTVVGSQAEYLEELLAERE